jgi:hypothetical protein
VRGTRVWARLLGVKSAVVEDVYCGDEGEVVVAVRPRWRERDRCGVCRRRSPGFDMGEGRRRWRALDLGTTFAFVEADAPRVRCARHGVVVCAAPWHPTGRWAQPNSPSAATRGLCSPGRVLSGQGPGAHERRSYRVMGPALSCAVPLPSAGYA